MAATIIDGRAVAARVRAGVAQEVERFVAEAGTRPGLATVLVGDDPGSAVYVASKQKAAAEVGIEAHDHRLPGDTPEADVVALLGRLNADPAVSGILLQLPVPPPLDGPALTALIDPGKDVDGLTPTSAGLLAQGRPGLVPCTPAGVMELLRDTGVELSGARAVVIGRSILVGKPLAALLTMADATVTVCHSRTQDLAGVCAQADVLVAAVGTPRLVTADFVKPGATVIDVGMNRLEDGLAGDVDFDTVVEVAGAITPVPGGVGPMTIAFLLRNTVAAAEGARHERRAGR
ncbi:MAG: methylenetetrahydrofolate dehydrogenase / methenyltetrahydrofolate cyclohydrolase [Solirubrobacteraceae bacterium]|nr:methylenetetrahydrofolate dehydrogenase / methenyltetrahydrofolate cyclohydrolase [Solirubrobacteraceae bacterium]